MSSLVNIYFSGSSPSCAKRVLYYEKLFENLGVKSSSKEITELLKESSVSDKNAPINADTQFSVIIPSLTTGRLSSFASGDLVLDLYDIDPFGLSPTQINSLVKLMSKAKCVVIPHLQLKNYYGSVLLQSGKLLEDDSFFVVDSEEVSQGVDAKMELGEGISISASSGVSSRFELKKIIQDLLKTDFKEKTQKISEPVVNDFPPSQISEIPTAKNLSLEVLPGTQITQEFVMAETGINKICIFLTNKGEKEAVVKIDAIKVGGMLPILEKKVTIYPKSELCPVFLGCYPFFPIKAGTKYILTIHVEELTAPVFVAVKKVDQSLLMQPLFEGAYQNESQLSVIVRFISDDTMNFDKFARLLKRVVRLAKEGEWKRIYSAFRRKYHNIIKKIKI